MYGQANGVLSGTVADKTGSVIAGATVKITSQGTGLAREVKTDGSGYYAAPFLPVGFYTIRVESQGFQTAEQKDLRLQVDEQREINFSLNPASVSSTVEVSATEVAVETTNPTLGQVITSEQVADLPLNGRDFVQLATLTPGTTQETNTQSFFNGGPSSEVSARGTFSLSVGGSRASSTDWLLDGVDNNELTAGGIAILPSIDAIQEFKVLTYNFSAEYGTRAGPVVLVTTKSGSNQFHGSLFEFFRNTKLNAHTFSFLTPALPKEQFNLNQFGGAIGGPIQKDKTFFFADYQAKRQRHGIPFLGLIPTPAMMSGDFTLDPFGNPNSLQLINPYPSGPGTPFICTNVGGTLVPVPANSDGSQTNPGGAAPCNIIPSTGGPTGGGDIDPVGQNIIHLFPQSNASNANVGFNYTNVPTRRLNEGEFDIRLDHNFSSKDSVFARFSYDQATSFVPGGSPGFAEQGAFSSTQGITNHGRNAAISETHIFSDRNINQVSVGFNRIFNHILSFGDRSCEAQKLGILGADINSLCGAQPPGIVNQSTKDCMSCGMTSIQFLTGYWSLGDRGFAPFQGGTNVFTVNDTFDMHRGKHDIRVGIGFRANQLNVETNAFQDGFYLLGNGGTYTGDTAADLLLGQQTGAIHDQTYLGATTGRRWKMFRPFVQDDWRVTSNLTLNLGLAWALVTPETEVRNRMADFNFLTGKYLVAGPTVAGCTTCIHSDGAAGIQFDKTALEPRIGVAWKVLGKQNTVLRFGYAMFHDSSWNQGAQGLWMNPPYFAESDNFNSFPTNPCPLPHGTSGCDIASAFLAFQPPPFSAFNPDNFTGTSVWQNVNFKQGRVQQFNANIEHELPGQVVLTAGYAGSRSHHILISGLNVNLPSPMACAGNPFGIVDPGYTLGCGPGGNFVFARFHPEFFPFYPLVTNFNDAGNATYNSLQLKAETKSARHGLYALVGYTYAHAYDSGFADNLGTLPGAIFWPLPGTQKLDWAHSQINLDHQFTASVIYDLPFGKGKAIGGGWSAPVNAVFGNWQATVIERITSGFPLFVVDSNNGAFSGSNVLFQWNGSSLNRPIQVGDPNKGGPVAGNPGCNAPARVHTTQDWFNPCAFVSVNASHPGELGTANRAPVNGPDFVNTDFSLIKNFRFTERVGLNFRAEFFNLFNHAQFGLLGNSLTFMQDLNAPSTFAKVNETVHDPRVIQFGLKLSF
jgi:hypothetical protein